MKSLAASNCDVSDGVIVNYASAKQHVCLFFLGFMLIMLLPKLGYAQVEISEFMAANDQTLLDEDGDDSDWIEIHNAGSSVVNLAGWFLTDDEDSLTEWTFPSTIIAAGDYLVVFASNKDRAVSGSELHTNFKLSSGGEYLALVDADGSSIISEYEPEYPQQFDDISYGADGYFTTPTPGAANGQSIADFAESIVFDLPHGIYEGSQTLTLTSDLPSADIRYTLDGSEPSTEFDCSPPSDGKSWSYNYYEGSWTSLPDFDLLTPDASGTTDTISTELSAINNNFGLRFIGCLEALTDGYYTLSTTSSDGSRIYVDGELVVDNDGVHSSATVEGQILLSEGLHTVTVEYFNSNGDKTISVDWAAPLRGQTYLTTPNDGQIYGLPSSSDDSIAFEFDLPADGDFSFTVSAQGVDSDSDSFWVQLDDQAFWQFETGVSTELVDVTLNNGSIGNDVSATLSAGEHVLTFYPREDGARIDSLTIDSITCDGPCGKQILEAEIQDVSGIFVMAGLDEETLPGESWYTYSTPLIIDQTSIIRAVAVSSDFSNSSVQTNSYIFLSDVISQSINEEVPESWPAVLTSQQNMDYGMDPDIVDVDSAAVIASLASLPSISVVTDIDNLLHPDFGIYVNAQEKGRYWERPVNIELIDDSGAEAGFSIEAGIRIRGGGSRNSNNPKHPFRFYFRGSYDGDLDYPVFGDEGVDSFEKLDLRSPGNYSWARGSSQNTFLREVWSRDTQKALDHPYTRSRYYHMYINGQYWGVTMTQERISKEYAKSYFGGNESDYDVIKHDRDGFDPDSQWHFEANDGVNEGWNHIWEYASDQTITEVEYNELEQKVDLENLIDYFLINGYEGDLDGATSRFLGWTRANNWYAVRDRTGQGLKWSFFQHDGEHTLGARPNAFASDDNTFGPFAPFDGTSNSFFSNDFMNPYWLHEALLTNIDYRQKMIDRVAELFTAGGVLSNAQGLVRWNEREEQVSPAMLAHSARWGDAATPNTPFTIADWQDEVSFVENTFFADRAEVVFAQLLSLGLANEVSTPEVSIVSGTTVEKGEVVFITNTTTGDIYYTIDGSDPRAPGGGPSANAILLLPGEGIVINENTQFMIRVLDGDDWSPLVQADYLIVPDDETCYVISAKNGNTIVFCL